MNHNTEYDRWLSYPSLDERIKAELISIHNNKDEIYSRFYTTLNFGTAGLRGLMGAGTNRMNIYTVRQASYGFGKYICTLGEEAKKRGVVIAYDSRNNGIRFAENAALTLCALGIRVFVFDALRPTPELSFAIRYLKAIAGINITASHNPKEYNGYKAYFEDGAQIAGDQADIIFAYMSDTDPLTVTPMDMESAIECGLYNVIGKQVDDAYVACVLNEKLDLGAISHEAKDISIVYSPFYGAGYKLVPRVLEAIGANVTIQPDQSQPNGDFPTLKSPNPEEREGLSMSIELAKKIGSDLVIATDPDADRCATAVIMPDGSVELISGNQMGVLLCDFIIENLRSRSKLPDNAAVVSTIVSTLMIKKVCADNNVSYFEVLTGFKYIGEKIAEFESDNSHTFLLGFEESFGYLKGTYARDKDSVVAAMLITQMAMFYKERGMNLKQAMDELYKKYGYFAEKTVSFKIDGANPMDQVAAIMKKLRDEPENDVAGAKIVGIRDYKYGIVKDIISGKTAPTGLPQSDVLYYELDNGCSVVIRPSGTEPKVKLYVLTRGDNKFECNDRVEKYVDFFSKHIK